MNEYNRGLMDAALEIIEAVAMDSAVTAAAGIIKRVVRCEDAAGAADGPDNVAQFDTGEDTADAPATFDRSAEPAPLPAWAVDGAIVAVKLQDGWRAGLLSARGDGTFSAEGNGWHVAFDDKQHVADMAAADMLRGDADDAELLSLISDELKCSGVDDAARAVRVACRTTSRATVARLLRLTGRALHALLKGNITPAVIRAAAAVWSLPEYAADAATSAEEEE
ncbi:MAG: hypothetical protein PHI85_03915 [Victivallaceae bacterium]|nr:hypothetical protein [Victivallaceae bacterium]